MSNTDAHYPIYLEQVMFTRSVVVAIPEHTPANEPVTLNPVNHLGLNKVAGREHAFMAIMSCKLNTELDPRLPYAIDMECIATLSTDGSLDEASEHRALMINAHSVCYGAIREAVAWLTARQPYGPISLSLSVLKFAAPATPAPPPGPPGSP